MADLSEKVEKESKFLYKTNQCKNVSQKTQLGKETNFIDKCHQVSERDMGKKEVQMRRNLDKLETEKLKLSKSSTHGIPFTATEDDEKYSPRKSQMRLDKDGYDSVSAKGSFTTQPKSGRRVPIPAESARSTLAFKKSTANLSEEAETARAKQKSKNEEESMKLNVKMAAFLKSENIKTQRKMSLPGLIVTDESGQSTDLASGPPTPKSSTGKAVVSRKKSTTKSKGLPTKEEIEGLYAMAALQTNTNVDEFVSPSSTSRGRRGSLGASSQTTYKGYIDLGKLKEIEDLLRETSLHRKKHKGITPDSHSSRAQQRRLERLKDLLASLKKREGPSFKPLEMLNCSYLRLSKTNVEELEEMVRASGQDPGIHYHSDVSNYDLFGELRKEAAEEIRRTNSSLKPPTEPSTTKRRSSLR